MLKEREDMENNAPVIIGAGTIGSYFANKISDLDPIIIEEHKQIGKPVHCTGLISKRILDLVDIPNDLILNKIKKARIYSPNGNYSEIGGNKTRAYVFDREKLDKYFAENLKILNEKYLSHNISNGKVIVRTSKRIIKTKLLIDCSGAGSLTFGKPRFLVGAQYIVKMKHDIDYVELYFGNKVSPGFFSWVVPVDEHICRIGLATNKTPLLYMNKFYAKLKKPKIIERQGGLIPICSKKFYSNNIIAIGDSACQTKPSTGGGVITGIISANMASEAVKKAYNKNNFSSFHFLKNYYFPWFNAVGKQILVHRKIRNSLNKMNDNDYNEMISFLNENKETINKYGDMDFPLELFIKLLKFGNLKFMSKILLKSI